MVAAILLAAATAVATPTPSQTTGSNITVTTCHAQLEPPPLRITYTNDATLTATEVDFTVTSKAGVIQTVTDRGNFATGKSISHVFHLPQDISPLGFGSARCVVTKVLYADGTSWVNPSPP